MSIAIVVGHAAFDERRRASVRDVWAALKSEGLEPILAVDNDRQGTLWSWRLAMRLGLETGCTHICQIPDDAILCHRFGAHLHAAVDAQPDVVFDCYANCDRASKIASPWYTTPDGYVNVGGVVPRETLLEIISWRDKHLGDRARPDEGINLWAMATGRLIWKTTRSLIGHRADIPSCAGNDHHDWRTPATMHDGRAEDWTLPPAHVGRTYNFNHWGLMTKVRPPMTRRAYEVELDRPTLVQGDV